MDGRLKWKTICGALLFFGRTRSMSLALKGLPEGSLAVIVISKLETDAPEYAEAARRMMELVSTMPGFLGMSSSS